MSHIHPSNRVRYVALGEVVTFLDHKRRPVREADRNPGPYPYLGANGQQGTIDGYLFDEPLVLLAEDGGHFDEPQRGIAYRVSGKTWVNNHAHVLRPGPDLDWAYLTCSLENRDIRAYISGTTRGKLTKAQAGKILVPLPPIEEQRRVAAILDQADALRAKRRAALAQFDEMAQAIFVEMFGDPERNPRGWPKVALQELTRAGDSINYGVVQPGDEHEGGIPVVRVGDLVGGLVRHEKLKRIDPGIEADYRRSRLKGDEVLVSCVGSIGVIALVHASEAGFNIARAVARIPLGPKVRREFVAEFLRSDLVQSYFTRACLQRLKPQ